MKAGKNNRAVQEINAKQKSRTKGLVGIFVAIVIAVIVFIALLIIQKNILDKEETVKVYAVKQEAAIGVKVDSSNINDYFKGVEVPVKLLPEGYIKYGEAEQLLDRYVNKTYITNDIVTSRFLVSYEDIISKIEKPVEVSFTPGSLPAAVGGILREGDRINIYKITSNKTTGVVSERIMGEAYITKAFNGSGEAIPTTDKTTPATLLNLIISSDIESEFHEAMYAGTLRLSKILPEA